jgi:septal ring factor EnvC (AmiA/AmiB activator)
MKKWIIIIAVVLVALIVIGVLYEGGYLNFKWNTLSMIFAALAGPYMYIKNKLFNTNNVDTIDDMIRKAQDGLKVDADHRAEYDEQITQRETKITHLKDQTTEFDRQIEQLQVQATSTKKEVKEMSSDEMAAAFEQLYGNERDE